MSPCPPPTNASWRSVKVSAWSCSTTFATSATATNSTFAISIFQPPREVSSYSAQVDVALPAAHQCQLEIRQSERLVLLDNFRHVCNSHQFNFCDFHFSTSS